MDELESFVWHRACEVQYPFGKLTPPWEGDRMASALALADGFATTGGVREIVDRFGDDRQVAADAYRYFGFSQFAAGLEALPDRTADLTVPRVRSAFKRFGLRWRLVRTVGEAFEIVNLRYAMEITPALGPAFAAHFRANRELYGPAGHPSTWN